MRRPITIILTLLALALPVTTLRAALLEGSGQADVLIGRDEDNTDNTLIQPPGTAADQSLSNGDVLLGNDGNDILIGLLGNDALHGGPKDDILIGGTEQGSRPNSDIIVGDAGNDINIWAPGDGSDAFIGGLGRRDVLIFGVIDRDANNVPIVSEVSSGPHRRTGVPTANLSGSPGFCTLERVTDPNLGFEFLVRFFVRASGALAVTIRTSEVEQVFCTSQAGGAITFADLTEANPAFVEVSLEEVERRNRTVVQIVR
ncbi:MAG: calcium-binding protein [Candidatus Binatia bacterium]